MLEKNLLENNNLWIVDVGASGGIDPRWEKFTSSYKAILFEPDPREYERLKSSSEKKFIVLNSALSDSVSTVNFNLCRKQQVSSVYLPNIDFLRKFPYVERFEVEKQISLNTDTLSNQLKKNNITEVDFIKLDTQGYELSILKGSKEYLDNVVGLEIEVEFAQVYENQPLFNEVDNFVRKCGFDLFDIKRYYWKRKKSISINGIQKGQLIFGDALYFKSPEQVLLMNIPQEKIIRTICIYLVYGYLDLAQTLLDGANSKGYLEKEVSNSISRIIKQLNKRNYIPSFKAKEKIHNFFLKVAKHFNGGWNSGIDKSIGNP